MDEKQTRTLSLWVERDLAEEARRGRLAGAVGRRDLVLTAEAILGSGSIPVLAGESGVGKTAVVHEIVLRAMRGEGPERLAGRKVLQVSLRRGAASMTRQQSLVQQLNALVDQLAAMEGIALFVRDLDAAWDHDLEESLAAMALRLPHPVIAEGEIGSVRSMLESETSLQSRHVLIEVPEPGLAETRDVLAAWSARFEQTEGRRIPAAACEAVIEIAHRFLVRSRFPQKAIAPLAQAAAVVERGGTVEPEQAVHHLARQHGLPAELVDPETPVDLAELERYFRTEIEGQDEAVQAIVDWVARIKAGLLDATRPLGTFLFVGPTGVGKTFLVRLVARRFFGADEHLVRLNMADFQDESDARVLFGNPAGEWRQRDGVLARRLAGRPFGILLLDEFEKAAPAVRDRFLQLFDEGSFINGAGETVSGRAFLIVATSNAGVDPWRLDGAGFDSPERAGEIDRDLSDELRLEMLNRFDAVVRFAPLGRAEVGRLARREIEKLAHRSGLARRRLAIEIDPAVIDYVLELGFDPKTGARNLKRAVERQVVTVIARYLVDHPEATDLTLRLKAVRDEVDVTGLERSTGVVRRFCSRVSKAGGLV